MTPEAVSGTELYSLSVPAAPDADQTVTLVIEVPLPGVRVVWLDGELDLATAPLLTDELTGLTPGAEHLVLDLSAVRFLGTGGLSALVRTARAATARGVALHLAGATHSEVSRPLAVTGLLGVFDIHPTVLDALARLAR